MANQYDWTYIGESITGASHKRVELRNQDSFLFFPESGKSSSVILAVSDGHGSAKSFRSHVGSHLAVKTAIEVIKQEFFLENRASDIHLLEYKDLAQLKDVAQRLLPQRLFKRWREAVDKHRENNDWSNEEKQSLIKKGGGENAWKAIEKNPYLAYGATLLVVLATEFYIIYIQLGDGDILLVDSEGHATRPIEKDPRMIANETTSLCQSDAWNEFRISLEPYHDNFPPSLILVATDGYANSFSSDEEFLKIGQDYLEMIQSKGIEYVEQQLEQFLDETSKSGSGDDMTLGIIRPIKKEISDNLGKPLESTEDSFHNGKQKVGEDSKHVIIIILTFALVILGSNTYLFFSPE